MNLSKRIPFLVLIGGLILAISCKEDLGFKEPIDTDTTSPDPVSNIVVESLPGKVKLTFKLPANTVLSYVQAVYKITNGRTLEAQSSTYNNSIVLEGFADTLEHEVNLYTYKKSAAQSAPVTVKVKALEAPLWKVFKSLDINNSFGGYFLKAENDTKAPISIIVLKPNIYKEFEADHNRSIHTSIDHIENRQRGMDTIDYKFGFYVKDRWGNISDTLYQTIKPLFEKQLDPNLFRTFPLPGDAPQVTNGARLEYAWDNRLGWPYTSFTHQVNGGTDPHMITFDTGVLAKLSRIWIRPYPEGARWYFLTTMRKFEIYGAESPSLTGALSPSWVLLGSYEVVKPSGLPLGTDNAEDAATASAGFSWDVDPNAPKVRYIRIRCLENFAGGTAQSINEIKVYGGN